MANYALLVVAVVTGIATFIRLNVSCKSFFDGLTSVCFNTDLSPGTPGLPSFLRLNVPFIDNLHCLLTPFFQQAVSTTAGRLITGVLLSLALAVFILIALESSRPGTRWFARSYTFMAAASQLLGISVAFPLFYLSSAASNPKPPRPVAAHTIDAIWIGFWLVTPPMLLISMDPRLLSPAVSDFAVVAFNLAPILAGPLLVVLSRLAAGTGGSIKGAEASSKDAVARLCYTFAGVCGVLHLSALLQFAVAGAPLQQLKEVILHSNPDECGAYFLWVDLAVLSSCVALWLVTEAGVGAVGGWLLRSLVWGPGASLLMYIKQREHRVIDSRRGFKAD